MSTTGRGADGRPAPAKGAKGKKQGVLGLVLEVVVIVVAAFAIAMLVQYFLIKPFTIHQISMESTLLEGDRILLSRLTYHFRDPQSGDVIVFDSPVNQDEDLVKRVVAVAGQTVEIEDGRLYVDGVAQEEPYLLEQTFRRRVPRDRHSSRPGVRDGRQPEQQRGQPPVRTHRRRYHHREGLRHLLAHQPLGWPVIERRALLSRGPSVAIAGRML